eukprot:TRINITY_DN8290_c0_g2_i4.p3 TRINITY_DN8290_c0_g2~~TRINITY_DN8290_c0_g2_i4.p3  ORF type:complete len:231 (+),score=12.69 TRINITY_DN8290_c0_g2_i4:1159-1851(+)
MINFGGLIFQKNYVIFLKKYGNQRMHKSIKNRILSRIYSRGRGWAFSANDFFADFRRYEIDEALSSLTKEGTIRRVLRGIYDYPMYSELLHKTVAPDMDKIAQAIARKFRWKIYPTGETALNYLSLSTQMPGHSTYLSNGQSRKYDIGGRTLEFKSTALKESGVKYPESALVIQALKSLGKEHIDETLLSRLRERFSPAQWMKIKADAAGVAGWIYELICMIAEKGILTK